MYISLSRSQATVTDKLASLLGWIYTLSWSASFYPQPLLNLRRRSTTGTTPSFPTLNVLGFSCYTASTLAFYYSPVIKAQYARRNNGSETTVRGNDVVFAVHALALSMITLSQFWGRLWGFETGGKRTGGRVGRAVWGIVGLCLCGVAWVVWQVWMDESGGYRSSHPPHHVVVGWEWIDVVSQAQWIWLFCCGEGNERLTKRCDIGICYWICEACCDSGQVYTAILGEL